MFIWVRTLSASTTVFRYKMDGLSLFTSLRVLELDFSGDGLSTQSSRATLLFKDMTAGLVQIKLTHLPRIDSALLSLIASRFPSLATLELSCVERLDEHCCWLCFEESSTCCLHSPIPGVYATIDTLVATFCKVLKPLERLETLFLGIFLSDADVLARHLERCAAVIMASPRTGYYPAPPFGPNECSVCCAEHAVATRSREFRAKAAIAAALPSMQRVGFSSWFPPDSEV
ncbi:hypothetical protein GY45DRAFT_1300567 [Cubamyces sp. BRFM 1775]|nr:hypothetical protein GY45DRAFT_1300567 [Cubamyces sp. BRFM 1775]